jgi:diguanylate cyclase (GGDEF)-like protein
MDNSKRGIGRLPQPLRFSTQTGGIKPLLLPGAALLALAIVLVESGLSSNHASVVEVCYYAAFVLGLLLAWRFHSGRVFSALVVVLLGQQAVAFFMSQGHGLASGPGRTALEAVAFLVPVNFALLAFTEERGIDLPAAVPGFLLLLLQAVFVAVISRPAPAPGSSLFHRSIPVAGWFSWTRVPQIAFLAFLVVAGIVVVRGWQRSRPVESGLLWAAASFLAGMNAGAEGPNARTYIAMAAVMLLVSVVETSYAMAYRDELTGLPSRRAFNDAVLRLESPYVVAAVDIDHFKSVNDTFGHETGDEVLCLMAARLARVTGGGQAFRVGGEEFTILFPGKTATEVLPDLEGLRLAIEDSVFRLRGADRRAQPRGSDRRTGGRRAARSRAYAAGELRVTVSIGVAEPPTKDSEIAAVIRLADQALYRAKKAGRNRIEVAAEARPRTRSRRKTSSG